MEYRQATDGQGSNDLKAIDKGRGLMGAKRIEACSMVTQQEYFFYSGIVRAAMKKKVRLLTFRFISGLILHHLVGIHSLSY